MDLVDLNELISSSRKVDQNILKKKRKIESTTLTSNIDPVFEYPYVVDDDDHCESPIEAYRDLVPYLVELSNLLNKSPETLRIYDPYYCEGKVIENLNSLGFMKVYNKKEDFYATYENNSLPEFDVIVTNPPYSADNIEKLLSISLKTNKPFFLLMPNYVYTKDYYDKVLQYRKSNVFYIVPKKGRYLYSTPKGRRQNKSSKYTAPFPTFWYCSLLSHQNAILDSCKKLETNCIVAGTTLSIPLESAPDNDPRKKKLRNSLKRKKNSKRKKAKQVITNNSSTTMS